MLYGVWFCTLQVDFPLIVPIFVPILLQIADHLRFILSFA
jgi:hypothetical protein